MAKKKNNLNQENIGKDEKKTIVPAESKCPIYFSEEHGLSMREGSQSEIYKELTGTGELDLASDTITMGIVAKGVTNEHTWNSTLQNLHEAKPQDVHEGRLVTQAHTVFDQGMTFLNKASISTTQAEFYMSCAIKLLRLHNETIETLNRYKRKGEQKVIVQHVNVNDGGKAIVGNMVAGGGGQL